MRALLLVLLMLVAGRLEAQVQRTVVLWEPPPVIGMYTIDSARVNDLPVIATADWPAFTDTVLAELQTCTRLVGSPRGYHLRTVAAPLFQVTSIKNGEPVDEGPYIGFTFPSLHLIYVVQGGLQVRGLVKHELLHALLAEHGFDPRHGRPVSDGMFKRCLPERPR